MTVKFYLFCLSFLFDYYQSQCSLFHNHHLHLKPEQHQCIDMTMQYASMQISFDQMVYLPWMGNLATANDIQKFAIYKCWLQNCVHISLSSLIDIGLIMLIVRLVLILIFVSRICCSVSCMMSSHMLTLSHTTSR